VRDSAQDRAPVFGGDAAPLTSRGGDGAGLRGKRLLRALDKGGGQPDPGSTTLCCVTLSLSGPRVPSLGKEAGTVLFSSVERVR
jgi:hypothetical protein